MLKSLPSRTVYSWLLCRRLMDHRCVGLFLDSDRLFRRSIYLFSCQHHAVRNLFSLLHGVRWNLREGKQMCLFQRRSSLRRPDWHSGCEHRGRPHCHPARGESPEPGVPESPRASGRRTISLWKSPARVICAPSPVPHPSTVISGNSSSTSAPVSRSVAGSAHLHPATAPEE